MTNLKSIDSDIIATNVIKKRQLCVLFVLRTENLWGLV